MQGSAVFLLLALCPVLPVRGEIAHATSSDYQEVVEELMARGNLTLVPPDGANGKPPVTVFLGYSLNGIYGQDFSRNGLGTTGGLEMVWKDPRLVFSNSTGVSYIRIDASRIWTPDIELVNGVDSGLQILTKQNLAVVYDNGTVHVVWGFLVSTRSLCQPTFCRSSLLKCTLKFSSWTHLADQINLTVRQSTVDSFDFTPNPDFNLTSASLEVINFYYEDLTIPFPTVYINFTLQALF